MNNQFSWLFVKTGIALGFSLVPPFAGPYIVSVAPEPKNRYQIILTQDPPENRPPDYGPHINNYTAMVATVSGTATANYNQR